MFILIITYWYEELSVTHLEPVKSQFDQIGELDAAQVIHVVVHGEKIQGCYSTIQLKHSNIGTIFNQVAYNS